MQNTELPEELWKVPFADLDKSFRTFSASPANHDNTTAARTQRTQKAIWQREPVHIAVLYHKYCCIVCERV